jgi:hypothetical protein
VPELLDGHVRASAFAQELAGGDEGFEVVDHA